MAVRTLITMRIGALLVVLVMLAVIIGGGVMLYRATQPEGEVLLDDSPLPEGEGAGTSQFIQRQPETLPPVDEALLQSGGGDGSAEAGAQETEGAVISMTDTGFSPATVTVPAGTAVTFVNNGQGSHWPASDVHPTHEMLPGFDSRRALTTGEQYSFTFAERGTWRFHDHLRPSSTGAVTVE